MVNEALEKLAMKKFANTRANYLSGGEAQRVVLARTMSLLRKIVLLDEPCSAEAIHGSNHMENCIRNTCKQDGFNHPVYRP